MSDIVENEDQEAMEEIDLYRMGMILNFHTKAMVAHCECLAMNAENMWAAILNQSPVYLERHYSAVLQKWGLMDTEGIPLI